MLGVTLENSWICLKGKIGMKTNTAIVLGVVRKSIARTTMSIKNDMLLGQFHSGDFPRSL